MLKEVFYFLKGYVIIRVYGKFPERVLNVATRKDILCWDVKPIKSGISFKVSKKAYPYMKEICENCGCTMKQSAKIGLSYTASRHKKRQALLWGCGLFFAIVVLVLSFLWEIRIEGLETIPESEILALLKESGISTGKFVYTMDPEKACTEIYNKNDKLAWIGIEIRGSCALVEVAEKRPKPYVRDETVPCNIVSDKDGVVHKLHVKIGEAVVKEGDAVFSGQLLVSGIQDSSVLGYRTLHADADISIRTWHEKNVKQPLYKLEKLKTGEQKERYVIDLFGLKIPLYFSGTKPPFEIYSTELTQSGPLITQTFYEEYENKIVYTKQQAIELAKSNYCEELKKSGEIAKLDYTFEEAESNSLLIHFTAELIESAGRKQEIERN